jgi:aarF domain-containing kinase
LVCFDIDRSILSVILLIKGGCLNVQLIILKQVAKLSNNYALIADEIGQGLYGELDYRHEAANAAEFALAHKHVPWLYVPKTLPHMTRRKVLVMEWLNGDRPFDLQNVAKGLPYEDGTLPSLEEARRRLLNMFRTLSLTGVNST